MMTPVDLDLVYGEVKFCNLGFSIGKSQNIFFPETIATSDLKVGRSRHLIEFMRVCENQGHFLTLAPEHLHMKIETCFSIKQLDHF